MTEPIEAESTEDAGEELAANADADEAFDAAEASQAPEAEAGE